MVHLRVLKEFGSYNVGEMASFSDDEASKLIAAGKAEVCDVPSGVVKTGTNPDSDELLAVKLVLQEEADAKAAQEVMRISGKLGRR